MLWLTQVAIANIVHGELFIIGLAGVVAWSLTPVQRVLRSESKELSASEAYLETHSTYSAGVLAPSSPLRRLSLVHSI
jgi:hypothetical protein